MRGRVIIVVALVAGLVAGARTPFSRPTKSPQKQSIIATESVAPYDTVWMPPADSVGLYGFEKTLRSARESLYATNKSSNDIAGIGLEITYLDMQGRMLHKRLHELSVDIPPTETRLMEFVSFDRQGLYYYYLSPAPTRAQRATPFKVEASVRYILFAKDL